MANPEVKSPGDNPNQIACTVYLGFMATMKDVLNFGEFKFKRDTDEFKYFKKQIMALFYTKYRELFSQLEERGLLERCECGTDLKNGWQPCPHCHGSGYRNTIELDDLIEGITK